MKRADDVYINGECLHHRMLSIVFVQVPTRTEQNRTDPHHVRLQSVCRNCGHCGRRPGRCARPLRLDGMCPARRNTSYLQGLLTYLMCVCVNFLSGAFSRAEKATVPRVVPVPVPRSCGVLITKLPTATLLVQASIGRRLAETSTDPLLRPTRPLEEPPVERLVEHPVQVPLERLSQWPDPLRASCPPSLNTLPP